jgi:uncharacterized delta-60 repeat protein
MTTLVGNVSSLSQAQFEGFFSALETAPNLEAELITFTDALDLGFLPLSQTAEEFSLTSTSYVIKVWNQAHTVQLGTVTYTGTGFNVTGLGDLFVANDVFGVGSHITGISVANLSGYTLWQYTGDMNIVTMSGNEVTSGSFNVTEVKIGSPGAGVEVVLTGNLTVSVATGTTGGLSGNITGVTQYVRQGGVAYKIAISGNLTPTADLIQDAMGDITSTTSNLGGTIESLSISRYTYTDNAGQVPTTPPSTLLVSVTNLQMDPTELQSLMFAMEHPVGPDMSFSTDGLVTTSITTGDDIVRGLVVQADGKILVGGTTGPANGAADHFAMARYNADGTPDTGFGTNGVLTSDPLANAALADAVVLSDGKILFAGSFALNAGSGDGQHSVLGRFTSTGAIDTTFSPGGADGDGFSMVFYETSPVRAMAVQTNGQILTAGDGFTLHRFSDVGVLDTTFGGTGTIIHGEPVGTEMASDMVIQSDGKFLVAGTDINTGNFVVARFNADGSLDDASDADPGVTFDGDGWAQVPVGMTNSHLSAMTLQADGKIVLVGTASNPTGEDVVVVRLNTNGTLDTSFGFGSGKAYAGTVTTQDHGSSVVIDPLTSEIIVAGSDGSSAMIWRFNSSGVMTTSSSTPLYVGNMGRVSLARQLDGSLVIAGSEQTGAPNNTDWSIGRVVDSRMTMDQILFAGNDTLQTGTLDLGFEISGYTGNDTITGGTANDTLQGGAGDDSLVGNSGNDRLMGDDGLDTLMGGAGNDWLIGGPGNDTLNGEANTDTASYEFAMTGVTVTLSAGGASVNDTFGGTDTLISIENIYGSMHNDTLTGDVNANRLDGGVAGDDNLSGGDSNDTLIGGSGLDTLDGGNGTADVADYSADANVNFDRLGVVVNLSDVTADGPWQGVGFTVLSGRAQDGWGNTDTLSNIEDVTGSAYNDFIVGSTAVNLLNGGAGSDLLAGGAGNDTLDGGNDTDTDWASYKVATGSVTVNLGTGTATGDASVGTDKLLNMNGVIGGAFADLLTGGTTSADFRGFKQELFDGGAGNDTIDGGRGTTSPMGAGNLEMNMAVYQNATNTVTVSLAAGTATGDASVGSDTLIGINAVRGSDFADSLTGGNASFDFAEWFEGGAGNDTINGGAGRDFAMYTAAATGVTVSLSAYNGTGSGDASVGSDTLQNIEAVVGSNSADIITVTGGDYIIQGRAGNDNITAGTGIDTIDHSADQDANGDGLGVVVNLSSATQGNPWQGVSFTVFSGQAQDGWGNLDTFTNQTSIESIRGSIYNDVLFGNQLGNNINGGDGADLLYGFTGNDTLDGGNAGDSKYQDWVSYQGHAANTVGVSVNLGSGTASGLVGSVDSDTLLNIDGVTGSNFDDTLVGGSSSTDFRGMKQEFFNGRSGNDIINGGRANDAVDMDASNFEMNFAMYHETTGFGVNVNLLSGTATGNGGTNASVGSDTLTGINAVRGSNFADVLTGGNLRFDYAEFFEGDGGNDTISGVNGTDYTMYRSATTGVIVDLANGTALDGKGGSDTLISIENVVGSDYDDLIKGDVSANSFQGRKGNDSFDGGAGIDTIDYSADQNDNGDNLGVVVNLSGSTWTHSWKGVGFTLLSGEALDGWGNTDYFLNRDSFENIHGSSYNDYLIGNGYGNIINGGAGSDYILGLTGNDTIDGGTVGDNNSQDWVAYFTSSQGVSVDLGLGTASDGIDNNPGLADIQPGTDSLSNIDAVSGSNFNDTLKGGSASTDFKGFKQEFFYGDKGSDTIDGGRANNAVAMDAGNLEMNMAMYHGSAGAVNVNLITQIALDGNDSDAGTPGIQSYTDTLIGINAVRGSNFDDTLTGGNALFDYVEFFEGGGGNDTIDGGSGFDYAMYTAATSGVNVNLALGTPTATGDTSVGTDTLISIEGVVGSDFSDTITGGAANEKLQGRMGNDVLDGGAGTDWVYYDGEQDDNGDGFGVTVNLTTGYAIDGWAGIDTLVNFENIRGSIYSDNLTGDGNNNVIWGQGGNDTIDGGAGSTDDAKYSGNYVSYTVTNIGGGSYTVAGADGTDTISNIERLVFDDQTVTLGGAAPVNYTFASMSDGQAVTFDPAIDTFSAAGLGPQDFDISPIESEPNAGRGLQLRQHDLTTHATIKTVQLLFSAESNAANMFKVNSAHITFSNGLLLLGDNLVTTEDDTTTVTLTGGTGNDILISAGGSQTLNGGDGNDRLVTLQKQTAPAGSSGTDVFNGGNGNDTLVLDGLTGGNITQYTVNLAAFTGSIASSAGNSSFTLSGIENVDASDVTDHITGDGNANVLLGWGGNDTLIGGAGNDSLDGGDGNNSLDGGSGFDVADYSRGNPVISVTLATGSATHGIYTDTLTGIESVIGTGGNDTLTGNAAHLVTYQLSDASEVFEGLAGNDTINGGGITSSSFVTVSYARSTGAVTVNLGNATATDGFGGADSLLNIDGVIGGAGNDSLTGGSSSSQLHSSLLFESFEGGLGSDTIDGGNGGDRVMYQNNPGAVTVTLGEGAAAGTAVETNVPGGTSTDTLFNIEEIRGSAYGDTFNGNSSNNRIEGMGGNDIINGGAGFDEARYSRSTSAIMATFSTGGSGSVTDGLGGTDSLNDIEQIYASDFNDTLVGGSANDSFLGMAGNDLIDGGTGYDRASYSVGPVGAGVTVTLSGALGSGTATDNYGNTDSLTSIESIQGSMFNDTLTGNGARLQQYLLADQSETFEGMAGNDTINGGSATPTAFATASYTNSAAAVTVNLSNGSALDGWGGTDSLSNIDGVVGSNFNDSLTGGSTSSQILASSHFEQFEGGAGDDTIDGGEGTDRANYQNSTGAVTVTLDTVLGGSYSGTATGVAGNDVLISIEQIRGSNFGDSLTGGDGNDAFEGRGGNDTIHGGANANGTDAIRFDGATAAVTVTFTSANAGTATGDASVGTDTFDGIELARGSDFNDILTGTVGDQQFEGMAGADVIDGGTGGESAGDTVAYGNSLSGVTVNLANHNAVDSWGYARRLQRGWQE